MYCTGFQILGNCAYWLNAEQQGLPFIYTARVPAIVTVSIALSTTEDVPSDVKTSIANYINDKPLDSAITDSEITAILQESNIAVNGSHIYTASIKNSDSADSISTSIGGLSPAGTVWSLGRPVAMYSYTDKITSNV